MGPGPGVAAAPWPLCVLHGLGMLMGQAAPSPCPSWHGTCLLSVSSLVPRLSLLYCHLLSPCGGPSMPESMTSPLHRTPIGWCTDQSSGCKPRAPGAEMLFAEWASVGQGGAPAVFLHHLEVGALLPCSTLRRASNCSTQEI